MEPFYFFNEISRNYGCYFPHNNIESVVNFIKKFYDNKAKRKGTYNDLIGGERKIVRGEARMVEGGRKLERRETNMEASKKSEEEGKRKEEAGKREKMGRKKSFFSAFFDREREMMRHKGSVDREKIVAILRRLERKRKRLFEKFCCLFWRYIWK